MKKILSLLMILMLASSTAMAAEKKSSKSKKKEATKKEEKKAEKKQSSSNGSEKGGWVLQFQGGMNLLLSSAPATVFTGAGFGGEISGAYAINKNFSIGLMTGVEGIDGKAQTGGNISANYSPTEFVFQYKFGGSTNPFLFLGLGIANSQLTIDQTGIAFNQDALSEVDFIFSPGIGLAFEIDENSSFFVQTRIDILAPSSDWKTMLSGSGIADGVYMPFQVGFSFGNI